MEKKKTKPFQLIVVGVFVGLIAIAVAVFSGSERSGGVKDSGGGVNYGTVTVWGTIPASRDVNAAFAKFNTAYEKTMSVSYVYVPSDTLEQRLLEALSDDKGPDAIILPHEWLNRNLLRIAPISYDPVKGGIGVREFKDTYTQAGELFLGPEGITALPLAIDPLVLYWNRDLFTNAGIVAPPKSWTEILSLTSKFTKKKNLDVLQSTIALGEYENIDRAKDILSLMFLQIGSPVVERGIDGSLAGVLKRESSATQAVRFYTDFANPLKSSYSWNRSLPRSQEAFLANDLAMYIDLASANQTLLAKNPRLNFDLAPVPQTEGQEIAITYGKVHGIAAMKKGRNAVGGMEFARRFSAKEYADLFAKGAGMAPMRKDLLGIQQSDAFAATLYGASLRARVWVDPQPIKSDDVFARMIDNVLSGKMSAEDAIGQADTEMTAISVQ